VSLVDRCKELTDRAIACDSEISRQLTVAEGTLWRRRGAAVGAHLGDGLLWLLLALSALLWGDASLKGVALQSLTAMIVSAGSVTLIKFSLRRRRPLEPAEGFFFSRYDHYSFPSGHAARMACLTLLMWASHPSFTLPLCALTLATLLSRLHLGLHYLSDIIGGLVIGLCLGLGVTALWAQLLAQVPIP